jgi:DNA repair exonuclease SbcCD nuclease subunit
MRLLVTSDLHLSDHIWKHRPIHGDSYHSWKQIVDLAIEKKVDAVVLAGDILDKQVNQVEPIRQLLAGLRRLTEAKIPVWFNQGQHEYQSTPWMELHTEGLVWLHERDVEVDGWVISGCDYQNEAQFQEFLRSERALSADILVCHQVWQDFMGDVGKPQGKFEDVPKNVKLLITGDYHEHIIVKEHGSPMVLSPGSTHMRSVAEPEDKEVFIVNLGKGKNSSVQNVPLRTRYCGRISTRQFPGSTSLELAVKVNAAIKAHLDQADQHSKTWNLPDQLAMPIIQLTHRTDEHDLINTLMQEYSSKAHLFFKPIQVVSGEDEESVLPYIDASDKVRMLDCLDNFVDKTQKPMVHALALALLSSPDPDQALRRWIKEQIDGTV